MHKHLTICSVVSAFMTAAACAGSQADQVKDARMEQAEASAQTSENSLERAGAAREDSLDRTYDARQQNIAAANQPGENATEKLNEISRDRALYQSQVATRVDKLRVRIDEAAKKIDVLGNRAPTALRTELQTATTEHSMLKQDVDKLNRAATPEWESMKSQLDSRISTLDSRIETLKASIEDV